MLHHHDSHDTLWKALAVIASHTSRPDLPAVLQVITLLTKPKGNAMTANDESLESLCKDPHETGICFRSIKGHYFQFDQHGHAHKPMRTRLLGEVLLEIRRK